MRSKLPCQLMLFIDEINSYAICTSERVLLHIEKPESANTEDGDELRGACATHLDGLIGCDACTGERSCFQRVYLRWHFADIVSVSPGILRIAPIEKIPGVQLF